MLDFPSVDYESFRRSPVGGIVPISGHDPRFGEEYEHFAFVPDPLPKSFDLQPDTWRAVNGAMLALGRLDQAGCQVPDASMLRRPTLRREAQATSALEGTIAPLIDVLGAETDEYIGTGSDLAEVLNYVRAAEYAFARVGEGQPITPGLLFELHSMLVRGTRADGPQAGRIRTIQVAIGAPDGRIQDARFVPPPAGLDLDASLRDWADWVERTAANAEDAVPAAAYAHYQFETMHPFNDGNGRLGRLVIVLQLMRASVLRTPLLAVSPWFETRRLLYQDNLQRVSMTGDWDTWVRFFTEGIRAQAESTARKVTEMLTLRDTLRQRARSERVKGVGIDIIEDLTARPVVTISNIATRHDVTPQAAGGAVNRLVKLGILEEMTARQYGRVFANRAMLSIVERS